MNAVSARARHEDLRVLGKQNLQQQVHKWCNPAILENPASMLFEGVGLHPGVVTGYLLFQSENIALLRSILGTDISKLSLMALCES